MPNCACSLSSPRLDSNRMPASAPDLACTDLACVRGERLVFAGLDLALSPGGAVRLIGPNGAGKSSLLRLLAGLLPPAHGRIVWRGVPLHDDPPDFYRQLRYLGHYDAIKPVLSPREMLSFWAGQFDAGADRVDGALERLGLGLVAGWPGRLLSSGQRRRLGLARLAASPGRLWLLDEPTVGLDRTGQAVLEAMLAEHRAAGGMVALSTHTPVELPDADTVDMASVAVPADAAFALSADPEFET